MQQRDGRAREEWPQSDFDAAAFGGREKPTGQGYVIGSNLAGNGKEPRPEVRCSTGAPASPGKMRMPGLPWHLNGASICAHGCLWITGEFMNRPLIVAILIISTFAFAITGTRWNLPRGVA
jgi:hypothetical protein